MTTTIEKTTLEIRMKLILAVILIMLVGACSPKVGSEEWCQSMKDKPKSEWTAEEAKDFAKHCIF